MEDGQVWSKQAAGLNSRKRALMCKREAGRRIHVGLRGHRSHDSGHGRIGDF